MEIQRFVNPPLKYQVNFSAGHGKMILPLPAGRQSYGTFFNFPDGILIIVHAEISSQAGLRYITTSGSCK